MVLFTVKRSAPASLALTALLVAVTVGSGHALGLEWNLAVDAGALVAAGAIALGLLASDAALDLLGRWILGQPYERTFDRLAAYFGDQSRPAVFAGGVLAGAEELLFRGVVLAGLVQVAGVHVGVAIVVAAFVFGVSHLIRDADLRVFVLWSTWEGVLLGIAYVLSGSIVAVALAHAVHDVVGFEVFARRR